VKHFFGGLNMFRKLMMGPAFSMLLVLSLGISVYFGAGNAIIFTLIGVAIVVPFAISAYMVGLMRKTIDRIISGVGAMSRGNLTTRIDTGSSDEMGTMTEQFNTFVDNLRRIMVHVAEDSEDMHSAGGKMDEALQPMVKGDQEI
jgi:methyl-accepting chemotaxis protein